MQYLHDTYFRIAMSGTASEDQRAGLSDLARTILRRDKLDAIVIAGTDLSPVFEESTVDLPFVDCSRIHIARIMGALHGRAGAAS